MAKFYVSITFYDIQVCLFVSKLCLSIFQSFEKLSMTVILLNVLKACPFQNFQHGHTFCVSSKKTPFQVHHHTCYTWSALAHALTENVFLLFKIFITIITFLVIYVVDSSKFYFSISPFNASFSCRTSLYLFNLSISIFNSFISFLSSVFLAISKFSSYFSSLLLNLSTLWLSK